MDDLDEIGKRLNKINKSMANINLEQTERLLKYRLFWETIYQQCIKGKSEAYLSGGEWYVGKRLFDKKKTDVKKMKELIDNHRMFIWF